MLIKRLDCKLNITLNVPRDGRTTGRTGLTGLLPERQI